MFRILNNKKVSKCISSIMLFAILFNNIIFPSKAFALTSGPSQPEFSSFDSAGSSEMVNLFTGDFSYNIPLMDVDGYPINISYHASPSMDQEASWVGLGWNINSGSVSRGMRGLPDDFSGETIEREVNIKDFKSWGVAIGKGSEIAGGDFVSYGLSAGMGVTKSNYKGVGLEFFFEPTLSATVGKSLSGSLTAGLGVKASTTDGVDIYPQVGIGGQFRSEKATASIGVNLGASFNSREGVKSINAGATISASGGGKKGSSNGETSDGDKTYRGNGVGFGVGSSVSIPASSQGFMPMIQNNMKSQSYSLDFKLGSNSCIVAPFGYIKGYYAQSGLSTNNISLKGYGYINAQNADRESLHDFSREKDGMMYPETPNMPIANHSYDMFYASGQGMEMAFRPHRNDIGILHDNPTTENSFGIGASAELMVTPDVNVGVNVNVHWSDGKSGRWEDNNDMMNSLNFTNSGVDNDYESVYLKAAGEKTSDDATFLTTIKNEEPVRVKLESVSSQSWKATNSIENNAGNAQALSLGTSRRYKRAVRNNMVSYLRADEAKYAAISKTILNYPRIDPNSFSPSSFASIGTPLTSSDRIAYAGQPNHISEVMVTNPGGSRYVYGIPVYNKDQQEVTFNISGGNITHDNGAPMGVIQYASGDASIGNLKGIDHYYEKNKIPAYAHSYLLTELLSSDYVDRTGDGPTTDDYGDYTRFNYTKNGNYMWRIPYMEGKALFNQGFFSDKNDDKGSYLYGNKDIWYAQSIETKNYVAYFVLNDDANDPRLDARGVTGDIGGNPAGGAKQSFLKEIRLYAKKDLSVNGIVNAKPIKVVHFEYNYSLCPGVANNFNTPQNAIGTPVVASGIPTNGKLTLKKIYFTYGKSSKGALTPYVFDYCNGNYNTHYPSTPDDNPCYNPASIDRWGYYKRNTGGSNDNNLDFPYTTQDKGTTDMNARAWCLTNIKTPAGSNITVTYEADDYAYVQNQEATQMFKTVGMGTTPYSGFGQTLYNCDYLCVNLAESKGDGVLLTDPNALDKIKQKYFKGMTKVYIKACVKLIDNKYEFVPLYADIDDVTITSSQFYTHNSVNYYNAIIKLKKVGINDDGNNTQINPIVKAAFQLGRTYLPGVVFPGSQTMGTDETIIKGLVTLVKDMTSLFSGINKALYKRNIAKFFDPARSIVRLYNPSGKKLGGGSRVKKIEINDNWNNMSGEASSTYGQEYTYTTTKDGQEISSGVASYEPLNGGDENVLRQPIDFSIKRVMAPNDEYFQEEPLGETFFPDALVGYSKVTVKNLDRTAQGIVKHATGKTEHEFYTAKDFPVIAQRTTLNKQRVKPKLIKNILNFGSTDKMYMSQGYFIKTNDMHGKPKGQKNYAEGVKDPYSGITYYYKIKAGTTNELDNLVDVIDKTNTISPKTIGQTTDMVTDARAAQSDMWGAGVGVNVNLASCSMYVPLVFVWPSFSHDKREFYSIGTTKLVNQYGLIDYVEAFDNFSIVKTSNLLYDDETGDVVLTSTINNYDAPVYNLNYPAYWGYDKMGPAFKNMGVKISGASSFNITTAAINSALILPGDELLALEIPPSNPVIYTNVWVAAQGGTNYLIKKDGSKFLPSTATNNIYFTNTRSGRRNLQNLPMSSVVSLGNPRVGNNINVSTSTKVLSSTAVEYSENWQMAFGGSTSVTTYNCTGCTPNTTCFNNVVQFVQLMFTDPTYYNVWNPNITNVNANYCFGPFYNASTNQYSKPQFANYWSCITNVPLSTNEFIISKTPNFNGYDGLSFGYIYNGNCTSSIGVGFGVNVVLPNINSSFNEWDNVKYVNNFAINLNCSSPNNIFTFDCFNSSHVFVGSAIGEIMNAPAIRSCVIVPTTVVTGVCGKSTTNIINPYVENIRGNWRPKYDYSYLVNRNNTANIKTDGDFNSFRPFYEYTSTVWMPINNPSRTGYSSYASTPYEKWIRNNEVQFVNQNGGVLQVNDMLNRRISTLQSYNKTLPVAAASNAYYNQIAFDGFEDYDYLINECSNITNINQSGYIEHFNFYNYKSQLHTYSAHTGKYSMSLAPGTVSVPNEIKVTRKLTNQTPGGASDDVPYTLKNNDNTGLFGPFYGAITQKFILSVWIKEVEGVFALSAPQVNDYASGSVSVKVGSSIVTSTPKKSPIINGWQKLEYEFTVANALSTDNIEVSLINSSTTRNCLFDDIRIHPFNANMKTMVYDPFSLRLMAEHDDRNFATFYEYDEEGTLVRVKKETEKGIYTIKETRSGLRKQ